MQTLQSIDLTLLGWLTPWQTPWLDRFMSWISASGGAGMIWVLLGLIAMATPRHRAAAWRVMLTLMLSYALVDTIVKPAFVRPRPSIHAMAPPRELPPLPRSFSFPSGHAAATFGAAVAVSRMWPQTRVLWWTLAVLIGYSRIYLGHHYPLDVACGALVGVAVAFCVLGGRHRATYSSTLPRPLPPGVVVRP
jgi:undecaprenyl-diphosphatase